MPGAGRPGTRSARRDGLIDADLEAAQEAVDGTGADGGAGRPMRDPAGQPFGPAPGAGSGHDGGTGSSCPRPKQVPSAPRGRVSAYDPVPTPGRGPTD